MVGVVYIGGEKPGDSSGECCGLFFFFFFFIEL